MKCFERNVLKEMFCTTLENEGDVGRAKTIYALSNLLLTVPVSVYKLHLMYELIMLGSISVAEWPLCGKLADHSVHRIVCL